MWLRKLKKELHATKWGNLDFTKKLYYIHFFNTLYKENLIFFFRT